jgi:GNAT superfamily N-acetyltransferase
VGKVLYDYVIAYAREIGCYNVTLNVWECNPGARKFYEAMGMVPQKTGMEKIL